MVRGERFSNDLLTSFHGWTKARGIEAALFDLDDTLIDTHICFEKQVELFLKFCSNFLPNININDLRNEFEKINRASFGVLGASQKKWEFVVEGLSELYGTDGFKDGIGILYKVFDTVPSLIDGARETLDVCQKVGLRLGLVTHASQAWTDAKIDGLGLRGYFECIKVIDPEVYRYKGSEHWQGAIDYLGVHPSRIIVVGDNLQGDIQAAHESGVKTLVHIPSRWHPFNGGNKPEGTYVVDRIGNLISTLSSENIFT